MASQGDIDLGIQLLRLSKTVAPADWVVEETAKNVETGRKVKCAFDADHPEIDRYKLNIRICVGNLDQVSFHSHLTIPGRRETLPIYRLDLFPGSQHANPIRPGDTDSGRVFAERETHEHSIEDDKVYGFASFARSPGKELKDFKGAWMYFCDRILISNPEDLPIPSPQGRLL